MEKRVKYAAPAAFLVLAAALSPWAFDFPLNDDWAYAWAARGLAATGRLTLSDWGASTQLPHVLAGALAAKLFGFSFGALRALNLLVAAAALFVFGKLLEEFDAPPLEGLAAALALAFSPLYLVLAGSFMTDVHYFFWMLLACLFYIRNLKKPEDAAALWLAGACAALAYLTRQLAVALPLAFTLALAPQKRLKPRDLAAAWALPVAAMLGYWAWFRFAHGPTWASENYVGAATLLHLSKPLAFLRDALYRFFAALVETGLLLLPLAAGFALSLRKFWSRNGTGERLNAGWVWLGLAVLAGFALANGPLPWLENSLSAAGLGTLTLGGAEFKPAGFFASPLFWKAATGAAVFSAVLLICCSGLALRAGGAPLRFLFFASFLQLGISLIGAKFFDRYLLVLLPWFAVAAAAAARGVKFSRPAAALALALYALIGWAGMKDYLAWNRAKWELASRPHEGLAPSEIAAGFDHDAWLTYDKNMAYLKSMKPLKMIGEWEWQKLNPYKALVTYAPDPRLKVLDKAEYSTPLSPRKGVLYLVSLRP